MKIPQKHIPGRFVSLVPPEFPAAKVTKQKKKHGSTMKQAQSTVAAQHFSLIHSATNQQPDMDKALLGVLETDFPKNDFDLNSFDW
jgi:hypothetical protein